MIPNEVFLSHSNLDQDFVTNLANMLRHHGIPVWYSQTNIIGAQQWHDEIGPALRRCDWFLLVLSHNSVASMWVKRELIFTLQQNRFENRIVPYFIRIVTLRVFLGCYLAFRLLISKEPFEESCRELLRIWGLGYQPSQ